MGLPPTKRGRKAASPKPAYISSKQFLRSTPRRQKPHVSRRRSLATDQREVFDWYEKNEYKDDAGDIFCPEWESRLTTWSTEFEESHQEDLNIHATISRHEKHPEQLELGLFFLAHSVAAFALWNLLQACYRLDRCICGTTTSEEIADWQSLRPFEYLSSTEILSKWKLSLMSFSSEVEQSANLFKKEAVASRLLAMDDAIGVLDEALTIVILVFEAKRESMACSYWMLGLIQKGLDNRYLAIEKHVSHRQS